MRDAAAGLEFVRSGAARVRITGPVALSDEEFGTVARGAVQGMLISVALITAVAVPGGAVLAADPADPGARSASG